MHRKSTDGSGTLSAAQAFRSAPIDSEGRVVADEDVRADVLDDPSGDFPPGRRGGHHLGGDAVQRGLEVGELAEAVGRPNQPAGLAGHLAVADPDQAGRAHRAGMGVGGLEVDSREVEAHRTPPPKSR